MVKEHRGLWDSGADCGEVCTSCEYTETRELTVRFTASLVAQTVKNLPEMQETWVQSLGWEDPPEKGMATHSSVLAWRIPLDRERCLRFQAMGSQRVRHDSASNTLTFHGSVLKEDNMYYLRAHGSYSINVLQRTRSVVVLNEKKILT